MLTKKDKKSLAAWNIKENLFPSNGTMESKLKFLVRYAILAPSGFNSQPWKFFLDDENLEIIPDYSRIRQAIDPDNRELYISLGAAAKNIELAAGYFGLIYDKYVTDKKIVFKFKKGKIKPPPETALFPMIVKRHTNRNNFLKTEIEKEKIDQLHNIKGDNSWLKIIKNKDQKKELATIIHDADLIWYKTKDMIEELEKWLRDDVSTKGDGIPTGILNLYKLASEVKYLFSTDCQIAQKRAASDKTMVLHTPIMAVLASTDDTFKSWIDAGGTYQLLALKLTSLGLVNGFFNTVVELKGQRSKLEKALGIKGKAQLVFRIGYADQQVDSHTPRRPLQDVIIKTKN